MPISTEEALSAYGFVYSLANSIPELKGYLNDAIQGGWTPAKLNATIQSSPWYQNNADTVRNLVALQATEPATYQQNMRNAIDLIHLKAEQLGRTVDDATASRLALQTLTENFTWDDSRVTKLVSNSTGLWRGSMGEYGGQAATYQTHMVQLAKSYGVPYSDAWLNQEITAVSSGLNSIDGFEQMVRARAKAAFPQFASQIDAGMTVRDIADPYISTMAKTLEIDEANITLDDRYIKKALAQTGQDGATRMSMPLWQFERGLKEDPRYDQTNQAKDDAFSTLRQIGRDWGFTGGSQ